MGRAGRSIGALVVVAVVLGAVAAGTASATAQGAAATGPFGAVRGLLSLGPSLPPAHTAVLTAPNETFVAGVEIAFSLNITGANCGVGVTPAESVNQITFATGDGFVFQEPGNQSGVCPWTLTGESIPLQYSYRNAGTYTVTASVEWANGVTTNSNPLTLNVTSPSWSKFSGLEPTFWGVSLGAVAIVGACLGLRRWLPTRPPLSPGEV